MAKNKHTRRNNKVNQGNHQQIRQLQDSITTLKEFQSQVDNCINNNEPINVDQEIIDKTEIIMGRDLIGLDSVDLMEKLVEIQKELAPLLLNTITDKEYILDMMDLDKMKRKVYETLPLEKVRELCRVHSGECAEEQLRSMKEQRI